MKTIKYIALTVALLNFALLQGNAQTTINTAVAPYTNNNGTGICTFNFQNTNGSPVTITGIESICGTAGATTVDFWYKTTPMSGTTPSPITAANGWILIATNTITAIANTTTLTTQPFFTGLSFTVPAGTTYAMAVSGYSGTTGRMRYHSFVTGSPTVISAGGCNYLTGTGIGWAITGGNPYTGSAINSRTFLGKITFVPAGACTNPPAAGTATATPSPVCAGASVSLDLTGNSTGSGQTYQWQRDIGSGFANISGSLSAPAFSDIPSANAVYKCIVTCGASVPSGTVSATVNPVLPGGTYTINSGLPTGGTNYQSFNAAIAALSCGISGPVIFNVAAASGPYTEQVTLPVIAGASAVNTVTFNGNGRTLQFTPVTAARHILKLDGADFVTINNLNIVGLAADFGWGIHLMNSANNNTISNCTINLNAVTSVTSSASAGIVASNSSTSTITVGNNASNLTVNGCTIMGGYEGISLYGNTGSLGAVSNIITNNTIHDFYTIGIDLNNNDGTLVQGNNIHRMNRVVVTTFEGIELGTTNKNCLVNANRIHDTHNSATTQSGTAYGVFLSSCDAPATMENRVTNNLIYNFNSLTGIQYGLYNVGSDGVYYYHNTVVFDNAASTSGATYAFHQTTLASNIQFKNNLLYVTRGGTGAKNCLRFATATSTIISNNNALYINSPAGTNGIGFYNAINSVTLNDWLINNSNLYDAASVSADPVFVNPGAGNYQPSSFTLDNIGTGVGVATDILGGPRNATTPDPGAYEFTVPAIDASVIAFVSPGTSGCYTAAETITVTIKNFGSSVLNFSSTPLTVNCSVSGAVTATLTGAPTGTLAQGASMNVTLSPALDMTANGVYTFNVSASIAGDGNSSNDALPAVSRTVAIVAGTVSSSLDAICVSGNVALTLAGSSGASAIQWQENTGSWVNVGSGGASFTPGSPITQTTLYRAIASCNTNTVTSNEVTVAVNNPSITNTTPATRCGIGSVTIGASVGGGATTANWYNAPSGGSPLASALSFTTPVINSSTTYYVAAATSGGGIETTPLPAEGSQFSGTVRGYSFTSPISFTITGLRVPSVASANISQSIAVVKFNPAVQPPAYSASTNAFTTLFLTQSNPASGVIPCNIQVNAGDVIGVLGQGGSTGILTSYSTPTGPYVTTIAGQPVTLTRMLMQFPLTTTAPQNLSTEATGAVGRVELTYQTGCESARVPVLAELTEAPGIDVQATAVAVCPGQTSDVSVSSPTNDPNYTYSWTSVPAGFTASGPGPHTVSPLVTTEYIVNAIDNTTGQNAGCTETSSITVTAGASGGTVSSNQNEICVSGTPVLTVIGAAGGPIQWQESTTGLAGSWANVGSGGTSYTPSSPIIQTMYYQAVVSCGVFPVLSNTITVTVNNPVIVTITPNTRCGTGTVGLSATVATGNTVNWYSTPTGGSPLPGGSSLASGATFTTPVISSTTAFYAEAVTSGGTSGTRVAITEIDLGTNDRLEITNVSPAPVNVTGWRVAISNSYTVFSSVNANVQVLSGTLAPGAMLTWTDLASSINPPYWGSNMLWNPGAYPTFTGWAIIVDNTGAIVDFVALNWPAATITSTNLVIGPYTISPGTAWNGAGIDQTTVAATQSISRQSNSDNNSAADFAIINLSVGLLNPGMSIPFTGFGCAGIVRQPVVATVNPAPVINVTTQNDLTCPGASTLISVSSPNDPNYTYSWTSTPAGFTASGAGPHSVTPAVTTTYSVSALDNTAGPNAGCAITGSVNVLSANSYCATVNNTGVCITNVTLNTLNNSTGCQPGAPFYSFQPASTTLNAGFTYALSVTANSDIYGVANSGVWFDWNKDGVFSALEFYQPFTVALTGTIYMTVPASTSGNVVMRVRTRAGGNPVNAGDACLTMGSGETEDYCINVIPAPPVPPTCVTNVYPIEASSISCAPGTTTLTWATGSGGGLPAGYNVYFGSTPAPPAAPSNPQTTLTYSPGPLSPGTYYWRVEPFNGFGAASSCVVNSFTVPTTAVGTITQSALSGCGVSSLVTVNITGGWTGALSLEYEAPAGSNNWLPVAGVSNLPVVINVPLPGGEVFTWGFRAAITDCQNGKIYSNYLTYISSNPAVPTAVTGGTRCGAGNVSVAATVSAGHSIEWWDAATGGNLLGTGSPFVYNASGNTTIYAASRHIATGCLSILRAGASITVNNVPTVTATNSSPVCTPNPINLTATSGTIPSPGGTFVNGTPPTAGSNAFPFNITAGASKLIQWFVAPGEFDSPTPAAAGTISTISFFALTTGSATYNNFTIRLGQTSSPFGGGSTYNGPMSVVVGPANMLVSAPTALGWTSTITLTTPFAYDPSQWLVVEVSHCGFTGTGWQTPQKALSGVRRTYNNGGFSCSPVWVGNDANMAGITIQMAAQPLNFSWTGPNAFTSLDQNPVITPSTLAKGGVYTVTITDGVGCTSTATTQVTVNNAPNIVTLQSPTLNGNAVTNIPLPPQFLDIPGFTTATTCDKVVNYNVGITGFPDPAESLGGITYSFSGATTGSGNGTGTGSSFGRAIPTGRTTVTVVATNVCGTQSKQFRVTVLDNVLPVITPIPVAATNTNGGECASLVQVTEPTLANLGLFDNCPNSSLIFVSRSDGRTQFEPYYAGTTTVTWQATDASSNVSTATQNVVVNNFKPVINSLTTTANVIFVGQTATFTANFTDEDGGGTHTVKFYRDKNDATPASTKVLGPSCTQSCAGTRSYNVVSDAILYNTSEVAEPKVEVLDGCNLAADQNPGVSTYMYLAIAVAGSQFTTAGGHFIMPAGGFPSAYEGFNVSMGNICKKATTGNSYKGQFEMNVHIPNLPDWRVHTDNGTNVDITWDYLTIGGCSLATFKGAVRLNGATGYKVLVQQTDKDRNPATSNFLRVKVTTNAGAVVFDTQPGLTEALTSGNGGAAAIITALTNGSIKVQPANGCVSRIEDELTDGSIQNIPNPFNAQTEIRFSVPEDGKYTLTVYNYLGQEVVTLFNAEAVTGSTYSVTFDGSNLESGIYTYTLRSANVSETRRMNLVK